MMHHALLPVENDVDRMDSVVACAAPILEALEPSVTLYHVFTEDRYSTLLDGMDVDSMDPDTLAKRNEAVQEVAARLREDGVSADIRGSVGDPASEIASYVESNDVDHVFLGGRRRSSTHKALFGSVSQQTLMSVDVPCTIAIE